MPVFRRVNSFYFRHPSLGQAYLLGYFAADGSMHIAKRGACYVNFETKDKELIYKIRKLLSSSHKVSVRSNYYRMQIGSKAMFNDLLALGMRQAKSSQMILPSVQRRHFNHFVRGYFDGDGCIKYDNYSFRTATVFTCTSLLFLKELHHQLSYLGVVKKGSISKKKGCWDLQYSKKDSLALFRFMYHNVPAGLRLNRKYLKFKRAFENNMQR